MTDFPKCGDCQAILGLVGTGPSYSYGDHVKCQRCRDRHERELKRLSTPRPERRAKGR